MARWLSEEYSAVVGLVTILAFHLYLRPWVAASLVEEQFTAPLSSRPRAPAALGPQHLWTVNLHLQEWERPSKTGCWDETLVIADHRDFDRIAKFLDAYLGPLNQQVQALSVSVRGDLENRLETLKTALPKALSVLHKAGGAQAPPQTGL